MLQPRSPLTTLLLAGIVALGPLATDMYLPALPAIGAAFGAGADRVQLTLSVYMAGFAVAQLLYGPLSDRFGRKPMLLGGFALFAVASIGCALAPSIEALTGFRFLQALGGAAGPVLGRAAVRDFHGPVEAARILSYMSTVMALAPALAPTAGGLLLVGFGWPAIFTTLTAYACLAALLFALALPEPLAPRHRQSLRPLHLLRNYATLLRTRTYIGYVLCNSSVFAGLFAFLSGSAFVLIDFLGVPPDRYGLYFAAVVLGYVSGTLLAGRCSRRLGTDRLILLGGTISLLGGAAMAALAMAEVHTVAAVVAPQVAFMAGVGIVMPQSMAGALAPFPHIAGSASALFGFVQMTVAATVGAVVGHLHDGSPRVMALAIAGGGLATLISFLTLVRPGTAPATAETGLGRCGDG